MRATSTLKPIRQGKDGEDEQGRPSGVGLQSRLVGQNVQHLVVLHCFTES